MKTMNTNTTEEIVNNIRMHQIMDNIEEQTGRKVASLTVDKNGNLEHYELETIPQKKNITLLRKWNTNGSSEIINLGESVDTVSIITVTDNNEPTIQLVKVNK